MPPRRTRCGACGIRPRSPGNYRPGTECFDISDACIWSRKWRNLRHAVRTHYLCKKEGAVMIRRMGLAALLILVSCGAVAAAPGDILIGIEAPSSLSPSGAAENLGMRLVIQAVNDQGGIN